MTVCFEWFHECANCNKPIPNDIDKYGLVSHPLCLGCFLDPDVISNELESEPCEACNGKGEIRHECDCPHCSMFDEDCWECDGKGFTAPQIYKNPEIVAGHSARPVGYDFSRIYWNSIRFKYRS